jgi:O-antigen ligase
VEHPDLAQIAAVVAAAGAVVLLAGRGRVAVLGGLAILALAEAGLAISISGTERVEDLASPAGGAAAVLGLGALGAAAAVGVRKPAWVPLAVLATAPLRPPIAFESGGGFPLSIAEDGQLGRLLPLYFVLGAAALALAWRVLRGHSGSARALPRVVALPAAGFLAFACLSLIWADRLDTGADLLVFFTVPFALLMGVVARAPFPDWSPRALLTIGVALASIFAAIGLYQAATRELFFFAPNLAVSNANSDYFRVTSLFGDPSLYGRHLVLGLGLVLVVLALNRIDRRVGIGLLVLMWAGLFVSYSQSSMVALVTVTLAIAAATGGRQARLFVGVGLAVVCLIGVGYLAAIELRGDSLRRETSDRTRRVEDTARVVKDAPVVGVGIGGQPTASRRLSGRDRPTPNFVSHTTPVTVAAELGLIGLALYLWLLVGGARAIVGVGRLEPALGLGLGASLLALFVHALFYSGFLEDPLTWVVLAVAAGYLTWSRRDDGVHRAVTAAVA